MGDPLMASDLNSYLDLIDSYKLKVFLVTAGHLVDRKNFDLMLHNSIKQVSFSINSFNANPQKISLEEYLDPLLDFVEYAKAKIFINFRLWNLDDSNTNEKFNSSVLDLIGRRFDIEKRSDFYQVAPKTRVVFDRLFEWASLDREIISTKGYCHGATNQLGILNDGTVVPCCLDYTGSINLGNILNSPLEKILKSSRSVAIIDAFKNGELIEELCKRCDYRTRFDKKRSK